jgi:lipid-binding SYLF domain-containing protein
MKPRSSPTRARQGLFAGINLSGGVVKSTEEDNEDLYGPGVAPRDVVLGHEHQRARLN